MLTDAQIEHVKFSGDVVAKMPKVFHKKTKQQILGVIIWESNTRVLNAQFFGNAALDLTFFRSWGNEEMSVEAGAFQNCSKLQHLLLLDNGISSFPPDAFLRLHTMIWLDLGWNKLSLLNEGWFLDLNCNDVISEELDIHFVIVIKETHCLSFRYISIQNK